MATCNNVSHIPLLKCIPLVMNIHQYGHALSQKEAECGGTPGVNECSVQLSMAQCNTGVVALPLLMVPEVLQGPVPVYHCSLILVCSSLSYQTLPFCGFASHYLRVWDLSIW